MKLWQKMILGIVIILLALFGIVVYLSQFHFDLSQDYRNVEGYENIVFKDCQSRQCFRLCSWGLVKTEDPDEFEDHRDNVTTSEYQLIIDNTDAENLWQAVSSPDGKYILYVERIEAGSGATTDDVEVYYRVYSTDDGSIITIYSGYRQFLMVDWK